MWRELEQENTAVQQLEDKEILLTMTGGLMIGYPDSCVVKGTLASVIEHNLPHEILDAEEIRERYPMMSPEPEEIGVLETEAGYLVPELCVLAHQRIAAKHGAILHFNESVESWNVSEAELGMTVELEACGVETIFQTARALVSSTVEVVTSKCTYKAKKLVVAAGSWSPELLGDSIPLSLHVQRRVLYWFEPQGGAGPFEVRLGVCDCDSCKKYMYCCTAEAFRMRMVMRL